MANLICMCAAVWVRFVSVSSRAAASNIAARSERAGAVQFAGADQGSNIKRAPGSL